ncbi:MAG TPA: methionine adenosyltransferase [Candidatus Saccharimonadales bacterium]|nr:methionine adenosyltransferase [Candidatus Saccharimonadales bacterium]
MSQIRLFTSESVAAGHPDKICDAISDAILDAALKQDPHSRTGIETVAGADQISLFGEIKTSAKLDYEAIIRSEIKRQGYTNPAWGFSDKSTFTSFLHEQSAEIAQGVEDDGGAGDQGMMFGYACKETPELMPLPITLAHSLARRIDEVRHQKILPFIRPDGKAQVTVRYEDDKPTGIEKAVIAVAHDESVDAKTVHNAVVKEIINPVLAKYGFSVEDKNITVNGTGLWHIPGPESDAGLTGRKIVVDTYGGYARVGGGAFSGKDPSKVDRSGAYAARYIAKNIVAAGLATRCEVGLAYVIGKPRPLMQTIETFGTATVTQAKLDAFAKKLIDTSVRGIIETLDLRRPIYSQTSAYGHFGKEDLPWEQLKKI